jgi:hypothetical protein
MSGVVVFWAYILYYNTMGSQNPSSKKQPVVVINYRLLSIIHQPEGERLSLPI